MIKISKKIKIGETNVKSEKGNNGFLKLENLGGLKNVKIPRSENSTKALKSPKKSWL